MNIKIERFAQQMQIELDNNNHKGSVFEWKGIYEKVAEFEYHKAKMMLAMRTGNKQSLKEYIADCSNILMSIGDEAGLYNEDSFNTGMVSEVKEDVFNITPRHEGRRTSNFFEKIL